MGMLYILIIPYATFPLNVLFFHFILQLNCFVCSHCFCYIGSIELQIGRRLYLQALGLSTQKEKAFESSSYNFEEACPIELSDEDGHSHEKNSDDLQSASSDTNEIDLLPKEVIESLMNGSLALPYSKQFTLPSIVPCPGGCEEEHYCR